MKDEVKHYLAAALANGIKFKITDAGIDDFCWKFVDFFNSAGLAMDAIGDRDGLLIMDSTGDPILTIIINNEGLKFMIVDLDRGEEISRIVIHAIGFLREFFDDSPKAFKPAKHVGLTLPSGKEEIKEFEDDGFSIV